MEPPLYPSTLAATALACAASIAAAQDAYPLMHVGKSDSRNEVHYATVLRPDCTLAEDPIRAQWVRRSGPDRTPRPLSWVEDRLLYGVRLHEAAAHRAVFTLAADDTRPLIVESSRTASGCQVRARVRLLGQWVRPTHAFVEVRAGGFVPEVAHVELHALRGDGQPVCERIAELRGPGVPCAATD